MSEFTTASNWRRLAALIYDSFLLVAISMAYGAIGTGFLVLVRSGPAQEYGVMFDSFLWFAGWIATLVMFFCWFWRRNGQTLGMRAWRLKLIANDADFNTALPSWKQCFMRCAAGVPGFFLFGLAYWYRYFDRDGDCLHDKLSGLKVIVLPKQTKR